MPGPEGFNRWCNRYLKDDVLIEKQAGRTGRGRDKWEAINVNPIPCTVLEGVGVNKAQREISSAYEDEVIVRGEILLQADEGDRFRLKVRIFKNELDGNGQEQAPREKTLEAVSIEAPKQFGFDQFLTVVQAKNA